MKHFFITAFQLFLFAVTCTGFPLYSLAQQDSLLNSRTNSLPMVRSSILPAEQAFKLSTFIEAPGTVVLLWEIKEGYYLYQKSISVADNEGHVYSLPELPTGKVIEDEFFGEVEVYFDRLLIRFPLATLALESNAANFTLQYQGCAKDLYCYPLQMTPLTLTVPE